MSLLWRKQAWVVEFYVPWCTYCQSMAPKWKLLTTKYAQAEYVRFGAANCMKHQPMCDRYPFTLVPTFMCFHSDKDYHVYEGIPDEEKIDEFIQKCEDDFKVHLDNGDPVFDKFMESGGANEFETDLEADDYDYDLTDGTDDEDGAESVEPAKPAAKPAVEEEEDDFEEDEFAFLDEEDEEGDSGDDDYDYELVDDQEEGGAPEQEPELAKEEPKSSSGGEAASSGLEEENRRLQEELQAIKQRMEGLEDMIAKMKTLFA